jgi:hypothetical protein
VVIKTRKQSLVGGRSNLKGGGTTWGKKASS